MAIFSEGWKHLCVFGWFFGGYNIPNIGVIFSHYKVSCWIYQYDGIEWDKPVVLWTRISVSHIMASHPTPPNVAPQEIAGVPYDQGLLTIGFPQ